MPDNHEGYNAASGSAATFLPAVGFRNTEDGSVQDHGTAGYYRSSMPTSSVNGYYLAFNNEGVYPVASNTYDYAFPVRCVRQ